MNATGAVWSLPPFSRYFTPPKSPHPSPPPLAPHRIRRPARTPALTPAPAPAPEPRLPEQLGDPGGALRLRSRRGGDRRERGLARQRDVIGALDVLSRRLDAVVAEQAGNHLVHGYKGGGPKP